MSIKSNQAQAVTDVKVLKSCRGKQYFLEAKCGVGAPRSREFGKTPNYFPFFLKASLIKNSLPQIMAFLHSD